MSKNVKIVLIKHQKETRGENKIIHFTRNIVKLIVLNVL